jgi:hypothetical protein
MKRAIPCILLALAACAETFDLTTLQATTFQVFTPSSDGVANDARPEVRWQTAPEVQRYQVTIYRDAALTQVVDSQVVVHPEARCQSDLPDDEVFYFQVEAIHARGATLGFTAANRFRMRIVPDNFPQVVDVHHDPLLAQNGYRLFNLIDFRPPAGEPILGALLVTNMAGEILWWITKSGETLSDVRVLPNGNLLTINRCLPKVLAQAIEITWDGTEVWRSRAGALVHHAAGLGPGGDYMYLKYTHRAVGNETWEGDGIEIVDSNNNVLWDWDAFDHLPTTRFDPVGIRNDGFFDLGQDWTHGNAVVWDEDRSLIWISLRHLSWIVAIEYPSGNVRQVFGEGGLGGAALNSFQHAPEIQADGQILFFDNGNTRTPPESRIVQFQWDEVNNTVAESFVWKEPGFYDRAVGDADRLPNSNILVTSGTNARLIEITTAGAVAWEMRLRGERFWIYRAEHLQPSEFPSRFLPFP